MKGPVINRQYGPGCQIDSSIVAIHFFLYVVRTRLESRKPSSLNPVPYARNVLIS